MKSLLFVTVLALIAGLDVVKAWSSCRREISQYISQNEVCAEGSGNVYGYVQKLAHDAMTYDEIAEKIRTECEKANSESCYNDISIPIAGSCNEVETIQHFRNALKTVISFDKYMCQNNGQTLLDFIKNDGAACYFNDEKSRCFSERYKEKATVGKLTFTNVNVCHVMNSDWECLHLLNDCENQNVYAFYEQILSSLREKFSC